MQGLKKAAATVVLRHEHQLLLMKRQNPPHLGKFLPVGGKIKPYENPRDAAKRELLEETGIEAGELKFAGILIETSPADYNWITTIFEWNIHLISPPYNPEGSMEWIDSGNLHDYQIQETGLFIYPRIIQNIPFILNADYNESIQLIRLREEISNTILI